MTAHISGDGPSCDHIAHGGRRDAARVDLIHTRAAGRRSNPAYFGENVTTRGLDLLTLPTGTVRPGDPIRVELPAEPHRALAPVRSEPLRNADRPATGPGRVPACRIG